LQELELSLTAIVNNPGIPSANIGTMMVSGWNDGSFSTEELLIHNTVIIS
jgi:hypothetical protein